MYHENPKPFFAHNSGYGYHQAYRGSSSTSTSSSTASTNNHHNYNAWAALLSPVASPIATPITYNNGFFIGNGVFIGENTNINLTPRGNTRSITSHHGNHGNILGLSLSNETLTMNVFTNNNTIGNASLLLCSLPQPTISCLGFLYQRPYHIPNMADPICTTNISNFYFMPVVREVDFIEYTSAFHLFNNLPTEIQLMIWGFALPEGTNLCVIAYQRYGYAEYRLKSPNTPNALLSACKTSKDLVLKQLTHSFQMPRSEKIIRYNPTIDKVLLNIGLGNLGKSCYFYVNFLDSIIHISGLANVEQLVLKDSNIYRSTGNDLTDLLKCFPNLKSLTIGFQAPVARRINNSNVHNIEESLLYAFERQTYLTGNMVKKPDFKCMRFINGLTIQEKKRWAN
ncbi:hypothetical protein G7Y89_g12498 [Cudoniella acicularis]|uniref:2EXR domain-containing protein n=1 Tax=Cudoniella acicularis TaxID=354080 RepID=A0A8H4RAB3_9HELO|nr:hypothetical protein G7Y89_g12498 [Cudoniella acicularis]